MQKKLSHLVWIVQFWWNSACWRTMGPRKRASDETATGSRNNPSLVNTLNFVSGHNAEISALIWYVWVENWVSKASPQCQNSIQTKLIIADGSQIRNG